MNLLIGALTEGFIFAPLALGLYLSYRVYDTLDLTVDGSFGTGAATVAALLVRGVPPAAATALGALAGVVAGGITGAVHTRLRVNVSLAGVLMTTALYSVTLFIMGGGNLSLASAESLVTRAEGIAHRVFGVPDSLTLFGTTVGGGSLATLVGMGLIAAALATVLTAFLRTDLGLAMRAAGSNPQMAKSVAVNVDHMIIVGLGLSNGVIALAGALFAQYQGFANIQMGIGAIVTGLATLMVGEALLGRRSLGRWVAGAIVGAVVFRLLIAGAIRAGLNANALKLVTALFVLFVLLLPRLVAAARRHRRLEAIPRHG
jgi:putative ABC transport system permease protein